MPARSWKRSRIHYDSDDEHDGDAVAPPYHSTSGTHSGMFVEDLMENTDVDQDFDQARQSGAIHNLEPSSSFANSIGTGGLVSEETSPTTTEQPRPVVGNMVIGRNCSANNDLSRRLYNPASAPLPKEQEKHFQPFTGASRNLMSSYRSESSSEATISTPMHNDPPCSVGYVVDTSLPSTYIRVKLPDGAVMTGHFNYYHTIADIRSFIDASRTEGWCLYHLVIRVPGIFRILTDKRQTIEQAQLFNTVVHVV